VVYLINNQRERGRIPKFANTRETMWIDDLTKQEHQKLKRIYDASFGLQPTYIKRLYARKTDDVMLAELIDDVASKLMEFLEQGDHLLTERLIMLMILSYLDYEVLIYEDDFYSGYFMRLLFYTDDDAVVYEPIYIRNREDIKTLLNMILHIGNSYADIFINDDDCFDARLEDYDLLAGRDFDILKREPSNKTSA
jgi:hypothetical protein